jgi:hypothetical protein
MRKLKYVKLFENFMVNEDLLYKPDGGPEKYLFIYGNKTESNKMIAHTAWEYKKKPTNEDMLSNLKENWPDSFNNNILSNIMEADEIEYLEDSHTILPMFRFKNRGKTLYHGDDGVTIIDGWISNKLLGLKSLPDHDFKNMRKSAGEGFINEIELDEFIESNKIRDKDGLKKVLNKIGYTILSNPKSEWKFIKDPTSWDAKAK